MYFFFNSYILYKIILILTHLINFDQFNKKFYKNNSIYRKKTFIL